MDDIDPRDPIETVNAGLTSLEQDIAAAFAPLQWVALGACVALAVLFVGLASGAQWLDFLTR